MSTHKLINFWIKTKLEHLPEIKQNNNYSLKSLICSLPTTKTKFRFFSLKINRDNLLRIFKELLGKNNYIYIYKLFGGCIAHEAIVRK